MRRASRWLLCPFIVCVLSLRAQVVQISAGSSSAADTQGGGVTVYSGSATTRMSLGSAQGVRLGFSREVQTATTRLTVGDTSPSLALLTDGGQTQRMVYARGTRLEMHAAHQELEVFSGFSGEQRGNALFSAVVPDKSLTVVNGVGHTGILAFQTLLVRGATSAALASVSATPGARTLIAVTAGTAAHKLILRGKVHTEGATWQMDVDDTSGQLRLQPEPKLLQFEAEKIGLNASISKRFGQRLLLDGARHEYATAGIDAEKASSALGTRSMLWEAGATLRMGSVQTGLRGLQSQSSGRSDGGVAWMTALHRQSWDTQVTVLHRSSPAAPAETTVQVDAGERVHRYVRVEEGMQLGTGTPRFDVGGVLEGNWGSLRVTHAETYVPYGAAIGFKRVLTVSAQWHVRNATVQMTRVSASGIESQYAGSMSDFEGNELGTASGVRSANVRMPRYQVRGVVRERAGNAVAGAAVAVGSQVVYTDSGGRWMARFAAARAVRVSLRPSDFLTATAFAEISNARVVVPEVDPAEMELRVARCKRVPVPDVAESAAGDAGGGVAAGKCLHLDAVGRFLLRMVSLRSR